VTFTIEGRRAVPGPGRGLSPGGRAFNDAWGAYERAVREAAARTEVPSAIECPRQDSARLKDLYRAVFGSGG
jgi:hypothetical protein